MKTSKKYKRRLKRYSLFICLSIITTFMCTLATFKLTNFSMPKINDDGEIDKNDEVSVYAEDTLSNSSYLNGIIINGQEYAFAHDKIKYDISLPYDTEDLLKVEYQKSNENQIINGENEYIMLENDKTISFWVTSEDKTTKTNYTINLTKEHSAYLKNIELPGYNLTPEFNSETMQYEINILESITKVNIFASAYDKNSTIVIEGTDKVSIGGTITVKVTNPYVTDSVTYIIDCKQVTKQNDYAYSGNYQEFIVPFTGLYKLECWGARGGKSRINGSLGTVYGKGGYSKGEILLKKGERYYVYVGQNGNDAVVGKDSVATWNGGGLGTWDHSDNETAGSGGGATDIRLVSGTWNDNVSLASRIMVAGGAGGTSWTYTPGNGGGLIGNSTSVAAGGNQTSGYSFGIGRDGWGIGDNDGVAGGGGGYYGGQTRNTKNLSSGAGGSGFVSGHEGCIAINSAEDITPKVETYSQITDSYHYSGKVFSNTELTSGISETSKASIDTISSIDTFLVKNITVSGNMTREFNNSEKNYYVELDSENAYPTITIETTSEDVNVEDGKIQTIETIPGETIKEIKATTSDGLGETYIIHFIRKASSNSHLKSIKLDEKEIEDYKEDTLKYEITMPYNIDETLTIDGIKKFPNQTIAGIGKIDVSKSSTICIIEVTSEDGTSTTNYTLILNKQPNTKLKTLDIKNQSFSNIFESDKTDYEYTVTPGIVSLDIIAIPYDDNAKVVIKGAGYIKEGKNTVTITVSRDGIEDTIYTIVVSKGEDLGEQAYDFKYTGNYQIFTAPAAGNYKFEAWGARGGYSRINGRLGGTPGNGGYTSGVIRLNKGDTFYIYVGGKGNDAIVGKNVLGGWNGGGLGTWDTKDNEASAGGGGATDIRLINGNWDNKESLISRIMVAGAGGGSSWSYKTGSGGGLNGISYYPQSPAGTQTSGYALGIGQDGWGIADSDGVAGGGSRILWWNNK